MNMIKAIAIGVLLACTTMPANHAVAGVPATLVLTLHYDGCTWTYYYVGDLVVKTTVTCE